MSVDVERIERALLTAKWDNQLDLDAASPVVGIAKSVIDGVFRDPLTSPSARPLFTTTSSSADRHLAESFSFALSQTDLSAEDEILRLTLAAACLHAFIQANWTGPDLDFKPLDVISFPSDSSSPPSALLTEEVIHEKSVAELAYGGEPAYHLAEVPIFLLLAKLLLDLPYTHCASAPWWRLRVWLVHLQILDEPAAVSSDLIPSVEKLAQTFTSYPDLKGSLLLEEGILNHLLGHERTAAEYFIRAARATQLEYELTGALGKRTKFQQDDITQLVLLAESRKRDDEPEPVTMDEEIAVATTAAEKSTEPKTDSVLPETLALNDDTLLEQTEFISSSATAPGSRLAHLDPSSQPALHPLDQCILLSLCLNISNTSPTHGLTAEQMAPYVARVVAHPRNWSVHTMALLLRSRLEAHRTRTVERSTLQLQALVDQMPTADSRAAERLQYVHALPLPSKWALEKELARRFLALGVVRSALEIFERREMWEDVVRCWQSMERPDKGVAIVRDLLAGRKAEADAVILRGKEISSVRRRTLDALREAKLWCLLGDLEPEHALEHYKKAWEVSRESSGRAMRSLGGYYFARGDYPNTVMCLRRAVAINPLLARSWFILGCAFVRMEDWEGAREAFTRCVAIDDEDGESWNNLASVYLRMGEVGKQVAAGEDESEGGAADNAADSRTQEQKALLDTTKKAIPFSNKILAFRALKQGLKYSYENWRMWSNYMVVAMDVGELSEACRALARVVEERAAKDGAACVDEDVLERLVDAVTRAPADPDADAVRSPNEGHGLLRRVTDLFELTILPRVASRRVFRARARLLTWQGRWADALAAHLDAYRCGAAGTMEVGETDAAHWREAVHEVEEIVAVLHNFGLRVEGEKWRLQARSIVRTFMGRTRDFADEPEWVSLEALLEDVRRQE